MDETASERRGSSTLLNLKSSESHYLFGEVCLLECPEVVAMGLFLGGVDAFDFSPKISLWARRRVLRESTGEEKG